MARCPYAPHRLILANRGCCRKCGGDVRVYAALRWLPDLLFNEARQLLESGELDAAAVLLQRAMSLRAIFPEAHWLMAAVDSRRGRIDESQRSLIRAHALGAKVDLAWLEAGIALPSEPSRLDSTEMLPQPASDPQTSQVEQELPPRQQESI